MCPSKPERLRGRVGLTAGVLFVLGGAAVAVVPAATTRMAGFLIHTDLIEFGLTVSWASFAGGLVLGPWGQP